MEAAASLADKDEALAASGDIIGRLYGVDLLPREGPDLVGGDERGHRDAWADMLRLQADGIYPAAFAVIRCPVLMLHGERDPHPGTMIRDSLLPVLPQLEYRAFDRCGHEPWRERGVRRKFLEVLVGYLHRNSIMLSSE